MTVQKTLQHIVIAGGGTAGWMAAVALGKIFSGCGYRISLVESPDIGTVGVGEATIPPLTDFNRMLGLSEVEFMQKTQATFKLGIEFIDWRKLGHSYVHGFGAFGAEARGLPFYNYWLRWQQENPDADIADYSLVVASARANKFLRPDDSNNPLISGIRYAYHLDAGLYAAYLRDHAIRHGVIHYQDDIDHVDLHPDTGFITGLRLRKYGELGGDFFIDCTGFRSLLLGEKLKVPYISWQQWLMCDRAVALPCESAGSILPYTQARAHDAGWQWRIPLQHRTGNGLVYSSALLSDDMAAERLLQRVDGTTLAAPRFLHFIPGRREKTWEKNCVAMGLAGGFIEPLESTSIHFIQAAITRLTQLFPARSLSGPDANYDDLRDKFNHEAKNEIEEVRDFIILHYVATERNDSEFWRSCSALKLPDSLVNKINLFRNDGRVRMEHRDIFTEASWLSVLLGQGVHAQGYTPMVNRISTDELSHYMAQQKKSMQKVLSGMPTHAEYLMAYLSGGHK